MQEQKVWERKDCFAEVGDIKDVCCLLVLFLSKVIRLEEMIENPFSWLESGTGGRVLMEVNWKVAVC